MFKSTLKWYLGTSMSLKYLKYYTSIGIPKFEFNLNLIVIKHTVCHEIIVQRRNCMHITYDGNW